MNDTSKPLNAKAEPQQKIGLLLRLLVEIDLALHLLFAGCYWWMSPKGFPFNHARFWLNSVLPWIVITLAGLGLSGIFRQRRRTAAVAVICLAALWIAGATTGRILFPISFRRRWVLLLLIGIIGAGIGKWLLQGERKTLRLWIVPAIFGSLLGMYVVWAQLPPPATTVPINDPGPDEPADKATQQLPSAISLGEQARFYSFTAALELQREDVRIRCLPLLTFDRISPDRFWSILASRQEPEANLQKHWSKAGVHSFRYSDNSQVILPERKEGDAIELTAYAPLSEERFSHLNSFCVLEISGHKQLSLAFSPCRQNRIEVLPADYPTGRPARFAYLNESDMFYVVQATSGEKGPFHSLASGPFERGEPLSITVYDDNQEVVSIDLYDWSQQASTALSPTAGWNVPMNAIEFQRLDDDEASPVTIWISLAATSVGRGWETVGHRAGVYRSRIVFNMAGN